MWLKALRAVLFGLAVLVLSALLFAGGAFLGRKTAQPPAPPVEPEVPAQRRQAARDFVEAALAERFAGRYREALAHLQSARDLDQRLRGVDYQLALTQLELDDFTAAADAARRSISRDEETGNAQALLALIALRQAQSAGSLPAEEEIARQVQLAREADPLNPMPHYVLAEYYRAAGQPDRAVDAYQRAIERVPKSDSVLIATVKAGLAGLRLNFSPSSPPYNPLEINGVAPPEQLFFGAADALLRGDRDKAAGYLRTVRERISEPVFKALLQDSFFQDYLVPGLLDETGAPTPQP